MDKSSELLTTNEAALLLRMCPRKLLGLIRDEWIKASKIGRIYLIARREIDRKLEESSVIKRH